MTTNMSSRVTTTQGKYAALATLAGGAAVIGFADFGWDGTGNPGALSIAGFVVGGLIMAATLVTFAAATWQRVVRPGWWLSILPALPMGLAAGWILAAFAHLGADEGVETVIWGVLLFGPIVALLAVWVAGWSAFMAKRDKSRATTAQVTALV